MKILQLCIRIPYPPADGGSIAMYNIGQSLMQNGAELKILAFNTIKQFVPVNELPTAYREATQLESVFLDNRVKPFAALLNLFSRDSYNIIRFIRRDFDELLVHTLKTQEFDIIQMESLFMIPYLETIRRYSKARVVFRTHNIEHLIWERMARQEKIALRSWYLNLLCKRLRQYELWAINRADAIVAMTPEDEASLRRLGAEVPVFIAPVGIDADAYESTVTPDPDTVFHIGAMDWLPNQEGIRWFMEEIWPLVIKSNSSLKLKLAGKNMPDQFMKYNNDRCSVEAWVPDAKLFIATGNIMVVPLLSGSGMRVKIIEGMAMGKAIVTTTIGAEGLPVKSGQNILLADTVSDFAAAILKLAGDPALAHSLGQAAKTLAHTWFDNNQIGKRLLEFYSELLSKAPVSRNLYQS